MQRRERLAAGLGLALVFLVVVAAAGIRLDTGIPGLRIVHRIAASLEVLVVLWLAWMAWRRPAVQFALALTAVLSVVGIVGGQQPPAALVAVNLLGGLALAAVFAWIAAQKGSGPLTDGRGVILVLLALQVALGAWLTIVEVYSAALPAHGMLAIVLSALLVWQAWGRRLLVALALAAPLAGFSALHYEYSPLAALLHAAAAAALLAAATHAAGRRA